MIVADCSALVDSLAAVAGTDALRAEIISEELHSPSLVDSEIVSAVRGLTLGGSITTT